jgi:hypothetical protein
MACGQLLHDRCCKVMLPNKHLDPQQSLVWFRFRQCDSTRQKVTSQHISNGVKCR